jgi:signal transduction histidine kinase
MRIPWPRSLIARILLIELLILAVAMVILPPLTSSLLHGAVARFQNEVLQAQAEAVAGGLRKDPRTGWTVELNAALQPIFATGYDGRAYTVLDQSGRPVAASLFGSPALASAAPRKAEMAPFETRAVVGVSLPISVGGRQLWVVVTQDQNRPGVILDDVIRTFLLRYLIVLLPLLLLLPAANSLMARRLVAAVKSASQQAAAIDARTLYVRLAETDLPTEIVPLVRAINNLVERLGSSFKQQDEFSANVAHELRTPLATLQLKLEAVGENEVREQLRRQVERLSHVLSQLRDLASLEGLGEDAMERLDLNALTLRVVGEMAPEVIARQHNIEVGGDGEPVFVTGNAALIELALRNLIDNAVRHTPPGVRIEVIPSGDGSLAVNDNGPGVVSENLDLLVRRFWRADQERSDSAGIGLSIVQRIAEVHRGSLAISNRDPNGTSFVMRFRTASPRRD